jgi:toxin ParE1/3/4
MPIRFHRDAEAELIGTRGWYEQARSGLGSAFASEVERVISLINRYPSRFPFHAATIRRASLRRFPFSIFLEDVSGTTYIWAVFHHRRHPATIARRRDTAG